MQKVTLFFEKAREKNYWCFMDKSINNLNVVGNGATVQKALDNFREGLAEASKDLAQQHQNLPELQFDMKMDVGSLFNYYPLNITAFAHYIGMNASLLRQYASGLRTPKQKALENISSGLRKLKQDIDTGSLIVKPMVS